MQFLNMNTLLGYFGDKLACLKYTYIVAYGVHYIPHSLPRSFQKASSENLDSVLLFLVASYQGLCTLKMCTVYHKLLDVCTYVLQLYIKFYYS